MAAVTICSDFGAQKNKSATDSTVSSSIYQEVMGPDAMILVFWMLSFNPTFSLSFTFIKLLLLLLSRFSHVRLCATPWTIAYQAPPSMGFSRQEYWNGLPFPSPEDLPDPGTEPSLPHCRQTLYCLSHDQPRQHIKKQRHCFANKDPSSKSYGFSSSHVWM